MNSLDSNKETQQPLRALNDLVGYKIVAKDGEMGKVHDFFFDDEFWIVRYLVVDTGHWLPGRKVLLAPSAIQEFSWTSKSFTVDLTREQVRTSPDINTDQPVSRQRVMELQAHYNWPPFWTAEGAWPTVAPMSPIMPPPDKEDKPKHKGDPHLRSLREITGYRVEATDGDIGFVDDFIGEEETWALRYLVVSTHKWISGRKVLVSPEWLVGPITWETKTVKLFLTRENAQKSPEYDPKAHLTRDAEAELYEHHGRPTYWTASKPRARSESSRGGRRSRTSPQEPHTVHFEITNPAAHKVCLAGNFNDWQPEKTEMVPLGGGRWEKDLTLEPGTYEYRIVVDGKWMTDPNADHSVTNPFGESNSVLTVT